MIYYLLTVVLSSVCAGCNLLESRQSKGEKVAFASLFGVLPSLSGIITWFQCDKRFEILLQMTFFYCNLKHNNDNNKNIV